MEDNSVKISDEQYEQIGFAVDAAYRKGPATEPAWLRSGRAAVAAVAPLLLAEPSDSEMIATATDARTNWKFGSEGDYGRVRRIFANRLASLTAKPDPAVEAVRKLFDMEGRGTVRILDRSPEEIVAAVDAARAK